MPEETPEPPDTRPYTQRLVTTDFEKAFGEALEKDRIARGEKVAVPSTATTVSPSSPAANAPVNPPPIAAPSPSPSITAEEPIPEIIAKTPKAAESWKAKDLAHKAKVAEILAEKESISNKLSAIEKAAQNKIERAEFEKVQKDAEAYKETLRLIAIERDPGFQAKYDSRIQQTIEEAKRVVGSSKAEAVAGVLQLPDSDFKKAKVAEIYAELDDMGKQELIAVQRDLRKLSIERSQEIEIAKKDYASYVSKQKAEQDSIDSRLVTTFDRELQSIDSDLLKTKDNDVTHNNLVAKRIELARALYSGTAGAETEAKAALYYAQYPAFLEGLKTVMAERDSLQARITELTASKPSISEGGDSKLATDVPEDETKSYMERVRARAEAHGIR